MKSTFNKKFMAKSPLQASTEPEKKTTKKITPPNPEYFNDADARKHFRLNSREYIQWKLHKTGLSDPDEKDPLSLKTGGVYEKFNDEDFEPSNPLYN